MAIDSLEPVARAICSHHRLRYVSVVGGGTFKETFRATDRAGDVALKVFRPPASMVRARREVQAMLACDHPNIAKLRSVDTISLGHQTYLYCVEEFLAGGTLGQVPASRWGDRAKTRRLIRVLAAAVGHLAERGLVHRDLKPENIMLRNDGVTPVVVDFGIVRNLSMPSVTPSWADRGPCTPFFAPAEQLANEKTLIDWRSDQFSLGVTFSVLALRQHPYAESSSDDQAMVIDRVTRRESPARSFLNAAATADLMPLAKMVQPWPVERFRTPPDLITAWA